MIVYVAISPSKKVYVGQTFQTINRRKIEHRRDSRKGKTRFYRAIQKHGFENFEWIVLRECQSKEELDETEQFFISFFIATDENYGYNLKDGGSVGRHSDETKKKMSEKGKGRIPWNKGKTNIYSEETRKAMSDARIGKEPWNKGKENVYSEETLTEMKKAKEGKTLSEEHKKKISEGVRRHDKRVAYSEDALKVLES